MSVKTLSFADSIRDRFATAARLVRIIPVEYSPLMMRTPRIANASCAIVRLRRLWSVAFHSKCSPASRL